MAIKSADQITIVDITDAYSVILTSEAYTFVGGTSGVASGATCETQAVAFCGATQCPTVSVIQADVVCPTGISATVTNSGTSTVTIKFTTTATVATACEATIPVVVDGITVNKKFSFAVAKQGATGSTGASGQNAIIGILSNETHSIPTDASGNNGNFTGADTTMSVYNGSTDDSANWTVTAVPVAGVTGSLSGKKYTVTAMSVDTGYVDLTATRSGYANIVKRFTLTKNKQGTTGSTGGTGAAGQNATAYWLVNDASAISKSITGVYTPASLTITAKSQVGTGAPANYSGRFIIAESTDGTTYTDKYTSSANEATKTHTPTAGIKSLRVRLYLAGATTTLLDEQVIPVVNDGATGPTGNTGATGADAITLTITSSSGTIFKNNTGSTVLTAHVFKGALEQTITTAGVCGTLGTVKWYKDGGATAIATSNTITVNASDIASSSVYTAQLE